MYYFFRNSTYKCLRESVSVKSLTDRVKDFLFHFRDPSWGVHVTFNRARSKVEIFNCNLETCHIEVSVLIVYIFFLNYSPYIVLWVLDGCTLNLLNSREFKSKLGKVCSHCRKTSCVLNVTINAHLILFLGEQSESINITYICLFLLLY